MPLNGWLVVAFVVLVLLSPLFLLLSPIWIVWLVVQQRRRRREGWRMLMPFMADTLAAAAEVIVRGEAPKHGWHAVARRVDAYLATMKLSRRWRAQLVVIAVQVLPLLTGRGPFTMLAVKRRQDFVDSRLCTTRGLFGLASLVRQMVRLGYYAEDDRARAVGFVPMSGRGRLRLVSRVAGPALEGAR
jgi:hypothetical protein